MAMPIARKISSRSKLLKAAEDLMRESGYAAVTSRQVAARAGLKPQLVHYYFHTMDDLFLAVHKEFASGILERLKAIVDSSRPLTELWKFTTEARGVLLNEFVALANHRKAIRHAIAEAGNEFRRVQIAIIRRAVAKKTIKELPWSASFTAILLNSLSRGLSVESEVGMTEGHAEACKLIEQYIEQFEQRSGRNSGG